MCLCCNASFQAKPHGLGLGLGQFLLAVVLSSSKLLRTGVTSALAVSDLMDTHLLNIGLDFPHSLVRNGEEDSL